MCPWVGSHAPSFGRQLWGLPSRAEYLSPQGVLLPLVYGTTTSPLWLELRGRSAWQATPSWTVYRLACHRLLPWLQVTFAIVPDAAWPGSDQWPWSTAPATGPVGRLGRPSASDPWGVGSFLSLGRPTCVRCPGPLGSRSPVCPRGLLCCVCGVLGHLAPVHRCARPLCCVACAVSGATWLPFTGVPAGCVVLRMRCPGPLGSCSPVRPLGALLCVCGVRGHLAPVHRCARPFVGSWVLVQSPADKRADKHKRTPTPQPGVVGRNRKQSPSTHTHAARPSQEGRGTSGARTQAHTHPNTPARSGGAQPKPEPKHTHPRRTPQPGVAGCKRSAHTSRHKHRHPSQGGGAQPEPEPNHRHPHNTPQPGVAAYKRSAHTSAHTAQNPSQEWRGAAETRTQPQPRPKHKRHATVENPVSIARALRQPVPCR